MRPRLPRVGHPSGSAQGKVEAPCRWARISRHLMSCTQRFEQATFRAHSRSLRSRPFWNLRPKIVRHTGQILRSASAGERGGAHPERHARPDSTRWICRWLTP